ncbi:hypothetical protein AWC29_22040 [Mycobacterium triplex]|uniref:Mce associated membrane protein n=1 Tax=Mycobacterium triplex TaxID=47839 RepID=A0A024JYM8_9MYCO|nr:hypothetical protein AWC29_22040 [Mycobacterium triplex]CDO88935.1 Mce associated membrane protein [Mycobacterium triplex]
MSILTDSEPAVEADVSESEAAGAARTRPRRSGPRYACAASVSAATNHAVVLLFVNQTIVVGQDAPTSTASSVRVTLDRIGGRWLISQFDPV